MKVTPKNTVNLLWILVTGPKIRKPNKQDEKLFSTNNNKSKILPNS